MFRSLEVYSCPFNWIVGREDSSAAGRLFPLAVRYLKTRGNFASSVTTTVSDRISSESGDWAHRGFGSKNSPRTTAAVIMIMVLHTGIDLQRAVFRIVPNP